MNDDQRKKFDDAEAIVGHHFKDEQLLLSAITHPSAAEGKPVQKSKWQLRLEEAQRLQQQQQREQQKRLKR